MARINSRRTGISLSYVNTIANTVIGLFLSIYVIRVVGKIEYGIYQSMSSFLSYLTLLEFGMGSIMTRNVALCEKDDANRLIVWKNVSTVWVISLAISLVMALGVGIFYANIGKIYVRTLTPEQISYGKWIFLAMAVRMVLAFLAQGLKGCILGFEHYSVSQTISLLHLLIRTMLVIVLLNIFEKTLAMAVCDLLLQLLLTGFFYYYCRKKLKLKFSIKHFDRSVFIASLPLAFALFLQTIVNTANGNVDKFVISVLIDPESVAIYSVAMFIYMTYSALMSTPISMYMPQVARDMKDGKRGMELTETLVSPCRLATFIGAAILFGFISVGRQFIELFYGSDYRQAWLIALLIMIPMFINMTNGVLVNVLDVMNKRLMRSLCLMLTTSANIILTIIWVKNWSILGAALATCICTVVGQDILMNIYYAKGIKIRVIWLYRKSYQGILACFIISSVISFFVASMLSNNLLAFLTGGVLFVVVSGCLLFGFGFTKEEKIRIKAMINGAIKRARHVI